MIDKDPGMVSACDKILPATRVINCSWHAGKNLRMKVQKTLGDNWDQFHDEFVEVSRSLLPQEFDNRWSEFYARYAPRNQNLAKYLDTLRKDRFTWAWPWIRTVFTAGMQSTQRVEKAHHLVK
ncbi:hypothetical protein CPC16_006804, partial [Podila verticillata]